MLEHTTRALEPKTYSRKTSSKSGDTSSLDGEHDFSRHQTSQRNINGYLGECGNHANEYCDIALSTFKQGDFNVAVNEKYQIMIPSNDCQENTMKFPENIRTKYWTNEKYINVDNELEETIWILRKDEAPVYSPIFINDIYYENNNQVNISNDVTDESTDLQ